MPKNKNSKAQQIELVQGFMYSINALTADLMRKIPNALELLEEAAERDPNDYSAAVIRLVKAKVEMEKENNF